MEKLTIRRPDDFHLHLRDGDAMASIIGNSSDQFARAIIMPNLKPPIIKVEDALAYRNRILSALPKGCDFNPLMTLYLTDNTSSSEIQSVANSEHVYAVKYYPAGATTNSDQGVTQIEKVFPIIEKMIDSNVPLLIHGEATGDDVDKFDREKVFVNSVLEPLVRKFPGLKIVLEHISTKQAVQFVEGGPETIAATITPQHLLYNRNAIFENGLRPHYYCLPVLNRERHREAVLNAAVSGNPRFFLGTDSAPHSKNDKESSCGCAGVFSAYNAIELYAEAFESKNALAMLENFSSKFGADFYGLPENTGTMTLTKTTWQVPTTLKFANSEIVPMRAGENCYWKQEK